MPFDMKKISRLEKMAGRSREKKCRSRVDMASGVNRVINEICQNGI